MSSDAIAAMPAARPTARRLPRSALLVYETPSFVRAGLMFAGTSIAMVILWGAIAGSVADGDSRAFVLATPAGLVLVRLFAIMHDCSHNAFFPSRSWNNVTGSLLGVLTLTPFHQWRRAHLRHHATVCNLDQNDFGYIRMLTSREYYQMTSKQRALYRLYHHPVVLFGVGALLNFVVLQRLTRGILTHCRRERASVHGTNAAITLSFVVLSQQYGALPTLLTHLIVMAVATTVGTFVFHVHHIFENSEWMKDDGWTHEAGALRGSSYLDIPSALHWLTGWIGIHHIHHFDPKIPCYRLAQCFREQPALREVRHVTLAESFRFARLSIWHEPSGNFVTFRQLAEIRNARGGTD